MNKAYRHVYKDGIGWVAIAENGSCVSSSKGSGTVSSKTKVEVLKNFFDLRNSVVLNNSFLLKGLFAATLFCGVFVGDLKAQNATPEEIAKIQNNGTTVYTDNDGDRMEKVVNPNGSIGFKGKFDKSIIDRIDSDGVVEIGGRHFVIPTGSLLKDKSQLTEKDFIFFEVVKDGSGNWRGKTFGEYRAEGKFKPVLNSDREVVQYDAQEKKWYMHNHAETSIKKGRKLYYGKKANGEFGFATWNYLEGISLSQPASKDGIGNPEMIDGYYKIKSETIFAKVEIPLGTKIGDEFMLNNPERLSLVGKDGINTTPIKYTADDQEVKDGKRKVGDNKNGTIRLGNVAKALQDDEAVNLGQLNETLKNLNTGTGKVPYVSINSSIKGAGSNYDSDGATGQDAIAIGVNAKASTESTIAIGRNAGQSEYIGNSIFIGEQSGKNSKKYDNSTNSWGSVVIGQQSGMNSTGDANLYIGSTTGASHTGSQNIFLGDTAKAVKYNSKDKGEPESTADLVRKKTSGNRNIYIGNQYVHPKDKVPKGSVDEEINDSIAIGTLSNASNSKSIAIGSSSSNKKYGALSIGKTSIAIGSSTTDDNNGSTAKGDNSISFGSDTLAIENDSVALGAFSVADRKALSDDEKQKVYLAKNTDVVNTVKNTKGAISVGKSGENGFTRQITNLAAGTENTDAVNVAQLKALQNEGFYTEANLTASSATKVTANKVKHQLGQAIKVGGNFKPLDGKTLTNDNINDYLSSENLATSINKDGSINLLMAKTPKFDDINISKDGKGGEYTNLTQWIKNIENSSSTSTGGKTKYFSVNSKETGNINNDGATGKNAIAIGPNAQAKSQNVVSIGESAGKTQHKNGSGSVFIGRNAGKDSDIIDPQGSENWGSAYIGQDSGVNSKGDGNIYMGSSAGINHQGSQNIFLGDGARNLKDQQGSDEYEITKGNRNIAIGNQYVHNPAKVYRKKYGEDDALNDTITIGTGTRASANGAIAIGSAYDYGYDDKLQRTYYIATAANGINSIALGSGIVINSDNGVAIGFGSGISGKKVTDAVALGSYSQATTKALDDTTKKEVYLGDNAEVAKTIANTKGAISVGKSGENGFTRQITNVAAGTENADAVNVAQLKAGIKNVVKYDSDANDKITLGGLDNKANPKVADGVTITNLKAGTVSENSKDAINGSQLYATNESIKRNTDKITKNEGDITNINQKLDGFNKDSLFKVSKNGVDPQNIGLNGEIKFNSDENIGLSVTKDTNGANIKYSLNKDLKNITSITNNGKKYTFGDTNLVETGVITNKDLTEKGYVTADTQKTTSISTDTNSGITVDKQTNENNTDYKLSLDEARIKEITGTTNLTADLSKKADKNAGNLKAADVASWQKKLGDGTNNAGNTGLITGDTLNKSLKYYSQNSDKTAEVLVKGDGLKLDSDETKNVAKYTLSLDEKGIKKLAGTEDLDDLKNEVKNKADIDATNVDGDNLTKWKDKLGVSELSTTINDFKTDGMFKVSSNSENPEAVVPNDVVDFTAGVGTDKNLIVSHEKTNDGVKVNYALNNKLKDIDSIGGNGKKVSFTNDGVDFGGSRLTNIADAQDPNDAMTLKQFNTLKDGLSINNVVEAQLNSPMIFTLEGKDGKYTQLSRKEGKFFRQKKNSQGVPEGDFVEQVSDGKGHFTKEIAKELTGQEKEDMNIGDEIKISTIHPNGHVGVAAKITNVKDGKVDEKSLEAINGSQLHASNKAIAEILGGNSTLDDSGVVTKPTYNITNKNGANITHNTIGGALTELNEFNKNFTDNGLFSVSKDSETPLNIKPNENISFIAGSNLALTVEKGDSDKGAKITYSLKDDLEGIKSIKSETNKPLKVTSNGKDFYFNNSDGTDEEKKKNVATMGDLDDISGDTGALKKAVAGDNKLNSNGIISQNADETKTPFTTIKTADDPEGKGDTKPKTLFETVDNTIKAINKGFYTEANLVNDADATRVKHQLGSTIKVTGTSKLTADKLSGENLATSINKDGSINLLLSKAPRFDSVNIGGNENDPNSGIKIVQGKDGNGGKDGNTLEFTGEDKNKGVTLKGIDGINGKDGKDLLASSSDDIRKVLGVDGKDGKDGKDAVSIKDGKLAKVEVQKDNDGNPLKDNEGNFQTEEKSPFTGIKTVELDNDGKPVIGADGKPQTETTKDQPKTYLEATNEIIDAINKGFYTEANLVNDADATRVKHQLGSTIKVTGTSKLTADKLSGENLATSINKDGSINLLLSKAPRFDSVNIGGNENDPDSGIKIAQDGKDGNVLKLSKKGADGKDGKVILRGLADGKDGSDAVTKAQLDEVRDLANNSGANGIKNARFTTDDSKEAKFDENNKLAVNGDENIKTSTTDKGIKISLGDKIGFGNKVATKDKDGNEVKASPVELGKDGLKITQDDGTAGPSVTKDGIDGGNKKLTNLASGLDGRSLDEIKADIKKANGDKAKMPKEVGNAATIGDLANVDTKVTNVQNITNNLIGGNIKDENGNDVKFVDDNGNLTDAGKEALTTNAVSGQNKIENTNIIQAINNINKQGTKFFHVNDGTQVVKDSNKDDKDSSAASTGGIAVGMKASVGKDARDAIAIGSGSQALAENSIAIGNGNVVKGKNSGAIGDPSTIDANNAYSLGNNNKIKIGADGSFAIGNNVVIEKDAKSSLALGEKTKVSVTGGVALGSGSVANRTNLDGYVPDGATAKQKEDIQKTKQGNLGVVSVGETSADGKTVVASRQITGVAAGTEDSDAVNVAQLRAVQKVVNQGSKWISAKPVNSVQKPESTGKDSLAIGAGAMATGNNSVALGSGSTTTVSANGAPRDNTVSVGAPGKERTISNVAPGVLDSDAATMGQLRAGLNDVYGKLGEYKKDASAGTASALAVGNLPQATIPGKGMVSLGSGFYDGESAMAIGLSKMSDSGKWVFKGSASYDSQEKAGAALSVGFHF